MMEPSGKAPKLITEHEVASSKLPIFAGPSTPSGTVPDASPAETPVSPISSLNPGTVEDLHKLSQGVFPMFFEGAKLLINKGLNNNFQVSHTLAMSSMFPSGYRWAETIRKIRR